MYLVRNEIDLEALQALIVYILPTCLMRYETGPDLGRCILQRVCSGLVPMRYSFFTGGLHKLPAAKEAARQSAENAPAAPKGDYSKRLSYNEQREYDGLEGVIATLEAEKSELETAMAVASLDHEELSRLATRLGEVSTDIEAKTERWIELDERA